MNVPVDLNVRIVFVCIPHRPAPNWIAQSVAVVIPTVPIIVLHPQQGVTGCYVDVKMCRLSLAIAILNVNIGTRALVTQILMHIVALTQTPVAQTRLVLIIHANPKVVCMIMSIYVHTAQNLKTISI